MVFFKQIVDKETREVGQCLRVSVAFAGELGFGSQYLHPPVTPVPGDRMPSSASIVTRHAHGIHAYMQPKYSCT